MHYRLYNPEDFSALYAVEIACFEPPVRFSRAYMRRLVNSRRSAVWIADENAKLAGFAAVEWTDATDRVSAYIETLEVDPAWRNRGIGSELLRHIEQSAVMAGASAIWLHVDEENAAAIRLYEGRGYSRQGMVAHYYADNHAAILYAKVLTAQ